MRFLICSDVFFGFFSVVVGNRGVVIYNGEGDCYIYDKNGGVVEIFRGRSKGGGRWGGGSRGNF